MCGQRRLSLPHAIIKMSKVQSKEAVMEKCQRIHKDKKVSVTLGLSSASLKARKNREQCIVSP